MHLASRLELGGSQVYDTISLTSLKLSKAEEAGLFC